tara:strand:- start:1103 stop:1285 length:183 start_codon:yes stop_codon:yes gene_type:complete
MGFIVADYNVLQQCPHCGHAHNDPLKEEDNMVKKTIKWIWSIVCWPFKKAKEWLASALPK